MISNLYDFFPDYIAFEEKVPTKPCSICGEEKPLSEFPKHSHYKDGLDSRCRPCIKIHTQLRNNLRKVAPPKPEVCDCCGEVSEKLCIDHDHETNEFRGWICDPYNVGIGKLGDNLEGIQKAFDYLMRYEKKKNG